MAIHTGVLVEELDLQFKKEEKDVFVEGIYIQMNQQNKNRRIYPSSIVIPDLARYNRDFVSTGRALGELDHDTEQGMSTKLHHAAIKIESLVQDGDNIMGKSKVLSTPRGKTIKSLLEDDVKLGVSLRAFGTASNGIVNSDYWLIGVDVVHDPSAHEAFLTALFEGRVFESEENGRLLEVSKDIIDASIKKSIQDRAAIVEKVFRNILSPSIL